MRPQSMPADRTQQSLRHTLGRDRSPHLSMLDIGMSTMLSIAISMWALLELSDVATT